jgi:hypothetical protein
LKTSGGEKEFTWSCLMVSWGWGGVLSLRGNFNIQQVISYSDLKNDEKIWSKFKISFVKTCWQILSYLYFEHYTQIWNREHPMLTLISHVQI